MVLCELATHVLFEARPMLGVLSRSITIKDPNDVSEAGVFEKCG
jgi:hypothetical protein